MVLLLPPIESLLSQLVSSQASPHTVLLLSLPSGSVLVSQSTASQKPWPELPWGDTLSEEDRNKTFAAVGSSCWEASRAAEDDEGTAPKREAERDPLRLQTEYGRTLLQAFGSFLLVLVASHVTPWTVLEHKLKAAEEVLRQPLEQVSIPITNSRNGGGSE
ncbi:BZ3500_MvSof-1268-A1-R1_Chr6-2g08423 [Microbotryum saponariae]|uniref:BZ3500_MvSof-1268-A1-R1_Chr6-2g08423 protein n=1 Tax=Microbotryum saponariae TaxID=289078 RepID=A0A2X0LQA1_9BASI|nr:BZ3500_MvSof-1268-A1-R1_Chr6-2g08423 [Microbotryum saponariae]SDA07700.1 BZ3501_MvSof-1269-A2-R1_Chr6-1g08137 [Microbotryum saponariae]